ncbi:hypothetical protein IWQ60_000310 [Tieghemiomyces parasiticus]|uniref:Uncharacterized protein n=1 Tax=Tieghemiomyces parasiticus TaxID=78921 RepID=A0A9W8AJ56_9FUNG|nr:hypothetical protein IWQ60_000310 [Tieghemiomyces parasiticus]
MQSPAVFLILAIASSMLATLLWAKPTGTNLATGASPTVISHVAATFLPPSHLERRGLGKATAEVQDRKDHINRFEKYLKTLKHFKDPNFMRKAKYNYTKILHDRGLPENSRNNLQKALAYSDEDYHLISQLPHAKTSFMPSKYNPARLAYNAVAPLAERFGL